MLKRSLSLDDGVFFLIPFIFRESSGGGWGAGKRVTQRVIHLSCDILPEYSFLLPDGGVDYTLLWWGKLHG
jgi:hypothetical protein